MMENEITKYAIPYFKGIKSIFSKYSNFYKIGVYGSRNSCQTVCDSNYAVSSFVSDMSTGYSGNLGYLIPNNWTFEQFVEKKITPLPIILSIWITIWLLEKIVV